MLDVGDVDAVARVPGIFPEEFREIDILVNNAGCALGKDAADEISYEDIQGMVKTNVIGLMAMTKAGK